MSKSWIGVGPALLGALMVCVPATGQPSVEALVAPNGGVTLREGRQALGALSPGFFETGWRYQSLAGAKPADAGAPGGTIAARQELGDGKGAIDIACRVEPAREGITASYSLRPSQALHVLSVHIGMAMPLKRWSGATWTMGARSGVVPTAKGPVGIVSGQGEPITIKPTEGPALTVRPLSGEGILFQDNREWNGDLELRIGRLGEADWPAGEERTIAFEVAIEGGMNVTHDGPIELRASEEWVELPVEADVEPGSALDWSDQDLCDGPAGKYGRVVVGESGHFEFADRPGEPVRFYGADMCFSALYPEHDVADRVARRLRMLGYNTIRIHHHESGLTRDDAADSLTLDEGSLDRLEYFIAALKREGIYITTDLYVSRRVRAGEIFPDAEGDIAMDEFKMLVAVSDAAVSNLSEFIRRFLGHVNPYTGMALKDDPVLMSLALVNEDNYLNFIGSLTPRAEALWKSAYGEWLAQRYGNRAGLARAWGDALRADEDPARRTVGLDAPGGIRRADLQRFCAAMHARTFERLRAFVRGDLGSAALLTAMNGWSETLAHQVVRQDFDFVDSHFYWDHPNFLERPWSLPSRGWSGGGPATDQAGAGARDQALVRLLGKPFTISEFNYTAPNAYRMEGGLLMGAAAAVQAWDGIYRFAYSHQSQNLVASQQMNYFDLASDPLSLASDRLGVLLFTRGDMKAAAHTLAVRIDPEAVDASDSPLPDLRSDLSRLAYVTRIGTDVGDGPADLTIAANGGPADVPIPAQDPTAAASLVSAMRERGWLPPANATDLDAGILASETGELTIDSNAGAIAISTPRTCAVFSRDPGATVTAGRLTVTFEEVGGAVWVTTLDGQPIESSGRLLVAHLTDVKAAGMRFADRDMLTLEAWGGLPYLIRAGRARVGITRPANGLSVQCLDMAGRAVAAIGSTATATELAFLADTRGPQGGCMFYEAR